MKIVFAPSGKRMIPYPPCGPAILEAALTPMSDIKVEVVDLEMEVWHQHEAGVSIPIYSDVSLDPWAILAKPIDPSLEDYQRLLVQLSRLAPAELLGISVMGYEQLASALLLMRWALAAGGRVIMGGQFFSNLAAEQVLSALQDTRLTITVGDGFNAIRQWVIDPSSIPENSVQWDESGLIKCGSAGDNAQPPVPHYRSTNWDQYERYATKVFKDRRPVRRAHVYVWDKKCPYRCTFCRVSSGSDAKLTKPAEVAELYRSLLAVGASQFNFMTNELNPSRKYLKNVLTEMESIDQDMRKAAWFTYLRPDPIDSEDFVRLRRLGCRLVRYGVETGSQRLSDLMKKDYHIPTITKCLHDAATAGVFNHVNLLVGFPGETDDDIAETLEFLRLNRKVIHSVRVNPFYLPPGSPMANEPERNNVRLVRFNKGFWEFDVINGEKSTASSVKARIQRIVDWCVANGIGFSATLPFETLNILSQFDERDEAIAHMREQYAFFWEIAQSDGLKARFGAYRTRAVSWEDTIYKRGQNYNVVLCND